MEIGQLSRPSSLCIELKVVFNPIYINQSIEIYFLSNRNITVHASAQKAAREAYVH